MADTASQSGKKIEISCSSKFLEFLHSNTISIAITTYQTNRLFLLGLKQNNSLSTFERLFDHPMGLHAGADRLFLATRFQVWQLDNILSDGELDRGYDRLFVPRIGYTTGDLDIHDLSLDRHQRPVFVNTLYMSGWRQRQAQLRGRLETTLYQSFITGRSLSPEWSGHGKRRAPLRDCSRSF